MIITVPEIQAELEAAGCPDAFQWGESTTTDPTDVGADPGTAQVKCPSTGSARNLKVVTWGSVVVQAGTEIGGNHSVCDPRPCIGVKLD